MEELLDGVEFGGRERAHRADHSGRSRAHDPARTARLARDRLPNVTSTTLAQATHHSIPTEDAPETLRHIKPFLA
jgi:hypothetical protein